MFDKCWNNLDSGYSSRTQQGSALLFSMIILVVMAAIGFVLASLVLREVSVARSFDTGLQAFYAAESGIERSLDIVTRERADGSTLSSTVAAVESFSTSASPVTLLGNTAQWHLDATVTDTAAESMTVAVPYLGSAQIDLYDPDNSISSTVSAESIEVQWNEGTCSSGRVEATFSEFSGTTFDETVYKVVSDCSTAGTGYDCMLRNDYPTSGKNYTVRLRALDCSVQGVQVEFYDADGGSSGAGSIVEIPSLAVVGSIGRLGNTQRLITATTRWVPSASGLTDFVLFSEESLSK